MKGVVLEKNEIQLGIAFILSFSFSVMIYFLARRQRLSFRYASGWLIFGMSGMCAGLLLPLVGPLARFLEVSPAIVLLIAGAIVLTAISVQLSISISGVQQQVRALVERIAELQQNLEKLNDD